MSFMSKNSLTRVVAGSLAVLGVAFAAGTAHADATLDRVKARGKITAGVILSGAPFGYIDPATRQQKGLNVDLARAIAEELGVEIEFQTVTPPNRVQFLTQGKVDFLLANMQYTDERAKTLGYAKTPFDRVGGAAVGRKDSGIKDWPDLKGKIACVSQGSNYAEPLAVEYGATVKALPSQPDSMLALKGGNCDVSVHVAPTVNLLLEDRADEWKDFAVLIPTDLIPSDSVVWFRKDQPDTEVAIDNAIKKIHGSGKMLEIAKENRLKNTTFLEEQQKTFATGQ